MKKLLSVTLLIVLTLALLLTGCRGQKAPQAIEIVEGFKYEYEIGETPDFSALKVNIIYNDGTSKSVGASELQITGPDTSSAGKKNVNIAYEGYTQSFEVTVKDKSIENVVREVVSIEYFSGINTNIFVGDRINFDQLRIVVNYNDGTEETKDVATNANIKHNGDSIDTTKAGAQTLTITFMNKSVDVVINVNEILLTGIEVDGNTVDTTIVDGTSFDPTGMVVYAVYNNGSKLKVSLDNLTISQNDTIVTISYQGKSTQITLSEEAPSVVSMTITTTGYENRKVVVGDTINTAAVIASASLNNGTSKTIANSELSFSVPEITAAGTYKVIATYTADENIKAEFEVVAFAVTKITINTSSVDTTISAGSEFSAANLSVILTLEDGSKEERSIADGVTVDLSALNTAEINNTSYITASYGGIVSEQLKVVVRDPDISYFILGVAKPQSLTSLDSKKNLFLNKSYGYVVGDDNPFIFKLTLSIINDAGLPEEGYSSYTSYFELYEGETLLTGAELDKYASFDGAKNSIDFTEEAIGKTFTIKTRPLHGVDGREEDMTRTHTVTVVDGYNIYEAWELNYITNCGPVDFAAYGGDTRGQVQIVDDFLKTKNATRPASLAGIVLHNDLIIKTSDIPAEYFVGYDRNNELWDALSIFHHNSDSENKSFNFYGNYYTIFSYNLPNVCAPGTGNQTDTVSNGQLFRFTASVVDGGYFDHTQYTLNINSVYFRDNNPNTDNEMTADRDMRGLIGMKVVFQEANLENVRFEAYYISFFLDGDFTTANLNECKLYNSWQNHIYIWSTNEVQGESETPREDYPAATLNVTNSSITKCGGPIIIAQTKDSDKAKSSKCGAVVNVDNNSELWTYVTGQEAWFKAMGVTSTAQQIQQLGYVLKANLGTSFITQVGENGNTSGGTVYMNIVMIQLASGDSVQEMMNGIYDLDGMFTKGGVTYMDMSDKCTAPHAAGGTVGYGHQGVATLIGQYGGQAPVFNTLGANGGVAVFDGTTLHTALTGNETMDAMNKQALTMGEYIAMHQNNMGFVLGYGYVE